MDSSKIFAFLRELKEHNDREWFHANKSRYDSAVKDFEAFVNLLIPEVYKFDKEIGLVTAKECIFRIYRDTRFSPDKTPYKTNFGAFIARGGRKSINGGYYLHLEDGGSMLAGGIYMPAPEVTRAIRQEIYFNAEGFKKILAGKDLFKYFKEIDPFDKLKKPPRDFPADFADIDLLKFRSYTIVHEVSNEEVMKEDFFEEALKVFRIIYPFNAFLNKAIGG